MVAHRHGGPRIGFTSIIVSALSLATVGSSPARGQDVPVPGLAGRGFIFCRWQDRGQDCDAWPIAEIGGNVTLAGTRRLPYVMFETGVLLPVAPVLAGGGSFFIGGGEHGYVLAVKSRARVWLGDVFALDIAPGLVLAATDIEPPDWIVAAGISWRDRVMLVFQLDLLERYTGDRVVDPLLHPPARVAEDLEWRRSLYIGVRVGLGAFVVRGISGRSGSGS